MYPVQDMENHKHSTNDSDGDESNRLERVRKSKRRKCIIDHKMGLQLSDETTE